MRFLTRAAFCVALACGAPASAQDTVPLPVRIDGPAHIRVTLIKSDSRDAEPARRATLTFDVALTKLREDTGHRGAVWSLTHVNGEAVTPDVPVGFDLRLTVDQTLTPLSVDNLDEMTAAFRRDLELSGEADQGGVQLLASLTPESAVGLLAAEAALIAVGQGTDLFPGEDNSYEFEGPLPWGGVSILMIGRYRLIDVDRASGKARVRWSQEADPESLLAAIPAMVEGMAVEKAKIGDSADIADKMRVMMANARFEHSRRCDFTIDMATGLAEKIDCLTLVVYEAGEESSRRETRLVATQALVS